MKQLDSAGDARRQPVPLYDALAADYDRFVNWEARLAHELPFIVGLFEDNSVSCVLDTACGTGHHALALAQRGYSVAGADLSAAMVEHARRNADARGLDVGFTVAGLGELTSHAPVQAAMPWDAALCLGNSLPHLLTAPAVAQALKDFGRLLRPGGLLLIQNRNFDRVWAERERFMDPQVHQGPNGETVFVRFYDFHPASITFNMIRLRRTVEGWTQQVDATDLRPILSSELTDELRIAGFGGVTLYGNFGGSSFDPALSGDLIVVATRE